MKSHDQSPPANVRALDLTRPSPPVMSGHLKLGGANPQGNTIQFTSYYMLENGIPCIPVMGEFHFSRYPCRDWADELLKMKAGGIDIAATYVFWNHIEEDEGIFDWSENRDLRQFVTLCGRCGLRAFVRVGPFAHGECRNGGIPDWLYGRPFPVRSNDPRYLAYVRRFYSAIAEQLGGLFFKDGGPIIGIQIENEYMHAGAPWEVTFKPGTEWVPAGSDGAEHMAILKHMAQEVGLDAPIYSCTAWLRSPVVEDEMLPMQGGYVFTPWSPDPDYRQSPTREFLFRNRHLNPVINGQPTYDAARYPLACCEIGGGIQDTYYHRDIVPPEAVEGLAVMNLAGGANLIGYYMYHGGQHPVGKHGFMNEFTVPRISYDFQAPIREFGQTADSYRSLRLLHLFLKDFGHLLAPMGVTLPDDAETVTPEDTTTLRYAVRHNGESGFVFLNSYQDHVEMQDIPDITFRLGLNGKTVTFPHTQPLTLCKNVTAILPFGLSLDGVRLNHATAQLMTRLEDSAGVIYVFFAPRGMFSEYAFDPSTCQSVTVRAGEVHQNDGCVCVTITPGTNAVITLTSTDGRTIRVLTLTREQAERTTKQLLWGQERLALSGATVVPAGEDGWLYSTGANRISLSVYPPVQGGLTTGDERCDESADGLFTRYGLSVPEKTVRLDVDQIDAGRATVTFPPDLLDDVHNVYLRVDYVGDIGNAFIDGKLVHDNFYNGSVWEIGLRHFADRLPDKALFLMISPIVEKAGGRRYLPTGMAFSPDGTDERLAVIHSITAVPEYRVLIRRAEG